MVVLSDVIGQRARLDIWRHPWEVRQLRIGQQADDSSVRTTSMVDVGVVVEAQFHT